MWQELTQHFSGLLKPLFPNHADLRLIPSGNGIQIFVDWKLNNDQERPNKRSRKIIIRFCQETLEDYEAGQPQERTIADNKIVQLISHRLSSFEPNPDTHYGFPEPLEEWPVLTNAINS